MNEPRSPDPDRSARVRQLLLLLCLLLLATALIVDFALTRQYVLERGSIWIVALAASAGLFLLARRRRSEQSRSEALDSPPVSASSNDDPAAEATLVSELTHALRTPLTAIQGFSELLNTRSPSESMRQEWLNVLGSEAQRMQAVLERAQDLVRLREGKVRLRQEPVHLYSWLSTLIDEQENRDRFTLEFPRDVPDPQVSIDSPRFRQSLILLVEDIRVERPQSSIAFHIFCGCAEPAAHHFGTPLCPAGASLRIGTHDVGTDANGYTMQGTQVRIETFANGELSLAGIDLGIARETLALHGASLWIPGDGTYGFGICIPQLEATERETNEREMHA